MSDRDAEGCAAMVLGALIIALVVFVVERHVTASDERALAATYCRLAFASARTPADTLAAINANTKYPCERHMEAR